MVSLVLSVATGNLAHAQWQKIATFDGYISYCKLLNDSVGFIGLGMSPGMPLPQPPLNVYRTTDGGTTWRQVVTPAGYGGEIGDIEMVDAMNGWLAVAAYQGGAKALWRTSDGGLSWGETSLPGSGTGISVTPKAIIVSDLFNDGHISTDGGATWRNAFLNSTNDVVFVDSMHGAVCDYRGSNSLYTSDGGLTWRASNLDVESWSLYPVAGTADFFASPEGPGHPYNGQIYESTDYGVTWHSKATLPFKFTGDMEGIDSSYLFLQAHWWDRSISEGFDYSTDQGKTWTNIGGPNMIADTRFSVYGNCHDGITIYGYGDSAGNDLYRYHMPFVGGASELSVTGISKIIPKSCSAVDTVVPLAVSGCFWHPMLDSAWLTGSPFFTLTDTRSLPRSLARGDSIRLEFAGSDTSVVALLHLRYDVGSGMEDTAIVLTGEPSPLTSNPQWLHRAAAAAYMGGVDTLTMGVDIDSHVNLDSLWTNLTDIQGTFAFDSSVVTFEAYLPPAGWSATSFANHGNAVDFSIHKISATPTQPLDLGTALFMPAKAELATTWVTLPRFAIEVGGQALSLCVSDNEDSHWSVKTLGEQSDVTMAPEANRDGRSPHDLTVYPNPAANQLFLHNPLDHAMEVTIYDAIGRVELSTEVPALSTGTVSLASLPRGTYLVSGHSGTCVIVSHE